MANILLNDEEERFKCTLRENIRPSEPIADPHLLQGRGQKIREIEQAFNAHGRHVFIFGDRGVGKTSLALTAASLRHPSTSDPLIIGCSHTSTFFDLIADLVVELIPNSSRLQSHESMESTSLGLFKLFSYQKSNKISPVSGSTLSIRSMNEAVKLIDEALKIRNEVNPIVIIDEFDAIQGEQDKKYFAELLKFLYDKRIGIRFIFCGISRSIDDLVGHHLSASRSLLPVELGRLPHEARWAVIENAADKLDIDVDRDLLIRIGQISDGFPYYVHLIGERLFWNVFEHRSESLVASSDDFGSSIAEAIEQAQTPLKRAYKNAVEKATNSRDYEHVLWAIADTEYLLRQLSDIYEKSYLRIMGSFPKIAPLDRDTFRKRLYSLLKPSHGSIIERPRTGWFQFQENIVRGYVRLVAGKEGVHLGREHL
jgi:hypothetical protein